MISIKRSATTNQSDSTKPRSTANQSNATELRTTVNQSHAIATNLRSMANQSNTTKPRTTANQSNTTKPRTTANQSSATKPRTTANQSSATKPRTTANQSSATKPRTTANQSSTTKPRSTTNQSSTTKPRTTTNQSSTTKPRTTTNQSSTTKPRTTTNQSSTTKPKTTATKGKAAKKSSATAPNFSTEETNIFSFLKPPFVHPLIIQDLHAGIFNDAFKNDYIVTIDLQQPTTILATNRYASRFYHQVNNKDIPPTVAYIAESKESAWKFSYRLVGYTSTGIHALHTIYSADNTPSIHNLLLVMFVSDYKFISTSGPNSCNVFPDENIPSLEYEKRYMLKRVGQVSMKTDHDYILDDIQLSDGQTLRINWRVGIGLDFSVPSEEEIFLPQEFPYSSDLSNSASDSNDNSSTPSKN